MTYPASCCIGCGAAGLAYRDAIVSPFVAARVFQRRAGTCRIALCAACHLIFFEDRFDETEAARLYADYRGEAYYRERHHWEPWYTRRFNAALGGPEEMTRRRAIYAGTIRDHAPTAMIETVLDYGGDRGQLMQDGPGQRYFVFDISGVVPDTGVTGLDAKALRGQTFDLVLLCEVLEHVSEPAEILAEAAAHVRPGGLLYVTVPDREFPPEDIPVGTWYKMYLNVILKSRWATLAADFWSTGFRVKFGRLPPLGFAKCHEHVNFFDQESLLAILRRSGLTPLACRPCPETGGLIALCRRPD